MPYSHRLAWATKSKSTYSFQRSINRSVQGPGLPSPIGCPLKRVTGIMHSEVDVMKASSAVVAW